MTITQTGRRLALVGALALVVSLLPFAGASAITGDNAVQLSADDNVATSIANSEVAYTPLTDDAGDPATPDNPPTEALIGRADLFADNLASGALQGAAIANGRPLFLNDETDGVNADVLAELDRILADGSTVHILGGLEAQGEGVETALTDAGFDVNRFAGETRTETAIEIATAAGADTALLVRSTGEGSAQFADSMGAGALAAANGWSILFTNTGSLNANTAAFLSGDDAPASVIVVGGESAISAEAYDAVVEIMGEENVSRVAGDAREDTAVALNGLRANELGGLAITVDGYGDDSWADGFTQANLSGLNNYPVVLVNETLETPVVPDATADYLASIAEDGAFAAHFDNVRILCGPTVTTLCDETLTAAGGTGTVEAFPPPPGPEGPTENVTGLTDRPELSIATVGDLVLASQATADNPKGLRVTYTYDEPIATVNATQFNVHMANGGTVAGTSASVSSTDNTMVTVIFDNVNVDTADEVAMLTIATNNFGAAIDFQGQGAIQGDFGIGAEGSQGAGAAGITNRPDLVSVGNFRPAAGNTQTAVDFVFDENAFSAKAVPVAGDFTLVLADQNAGGAAATVTCTGPGSADATAAGGTVAGGNGGTTITVLCGNATPGTYRTANQFARGYVLPGTVSDAAVGGNTNITTAAAVTGGPTVSTGPDLTGGSLNPDAATGVDGAVFTFDNTLSTTPTTAAQFHAYDAEGNVVNGASVQAYTGGQVLIYFADGALADTVGLYVDAGAVADTSTPTRNNGIDEIGVENSATADQAPGATVDPQLTGATVQVTTPVIGSPSNTVTYAFDEDIEATAPLPVAGNFDIFTADGTQYSGSSCTVGSTEDTDNTVTCSAFGTATSAQIGSAVVAGVDASAAFADAGNAGNTVGSEPTTAG